MIKIEETCGSAIVYADKIDTGANGLLKALCSNPVSAGSTIRIMPDVHVGKGCVIGTTMTLSDRVAPSLVGTDIGCGVEVYQVTCRRLELQKLDKLVHEKIPSGRNIRKTPHRLAETVDLEALHCIRHIRTDKAYRSIGTLGSGNHFIELDRDDSGFYWLIIHSGSRHLGLETAAFYQKEAFQNAPTGTPFELACVTGERMEHYLSDLRIVQTFAAVNRQTMADEIIRGMKFDVRDQFSTPHNYIDLETMILRKGAVSAKLGERLILPLNMRDGCLIGIGKGNQDWNESAPHGCGRLMNRADARNQFTLAQFKKEMKGIYSSSINRGTLDESPMAYKPMEQILQQIQPTVEIIQRLRPVYNFKAGVE